MLSCPFLGSQFGAKNRVPCTGAGVGVVSTKSIAWKLPVTPKIVAGCQHAPYHVTDALIATGVVTGKLLLAAE